MLCYEALILNFKCYPLSSASASVCVHFYGSGEEQAFVDVLFLIHQVGLPLPMLLLSHSESGKGSLYYRFRSFLCKL